MRTLIQVPDGLKRKALEIADKTDGGIICSESCYGGCDLRDHEASLLGCEKIIHIGHSKFVDGELPVEYQDFKTKVNPVPILNKDISKLSNYKSIGLVTSLQFIDSIGSVKSALEENGKQVFLSKSKKLQQGQILGCDITAALSVEKKVDCFLVVGSGKFHALGLALATDKPVLILDVEQSEITETEMIKQLMQKQSYAAMALAKDARKFGILISTKPGQMKIDVAEDLKKKLVEAGKKVYMFAMDEITPTKLEGFGMDAYICTACPRIAIENRIAFGKPILNPNEAEEIFK